MGSGTAATGVEVDAASEAPRGAGRGRGWTERNVEARRAATQLVVVTFGRQKQHHAEPDAHHRRARQHSAGDGESAAARELRVAASVAAALFGVVVFAF